MSDGAYLMDRIRARCVEEGECLLWQGTLAAGCAPSIRHDGDTVSIRRWLWVQMGKKLTANGGAIKAKCRNPRCVAEGCLIAGKRGPDVGRKHRPSTKLKAAALIRARSSLTLADVQEIRLSDAPTRELAERFGKAMNHIQAIRKGTQWNPALDGMTPFVGLGGR